MEEIIDKCIKFKFPLYSYLICYLLYNDNKDKITQYCLSVDKINTKDFIWLIDNKYLEDIPDKNIIIKIEDLKLTDLFKTNILGIINTKNITFDDAFEQLREHYPSKVPDPSGGSEPRRLHKEIDRCKTLYKKVIGNLTINEELHSLILQCINLEVKEVTKSRKLGYMQMLPTWLNKKGWEAYIDDVEKLIKKNGSVERNEESGGFIDDI